MSGEMYREVEALTALSRHMALSGLDLDSMDIRLAIVIPGPETLTISVDQPGQVLLWHETRRTYPIAESAKVARLLVEHLGIRQPEAGEPW